MRGHDAEADGARRRLSARRSRLGNIGRKHMGIEMKNGANEVADFVRHRMRRDSM